MLTKLERLQVVACCVAIGLTGCLGDVALDVGSDSDGQFESIRRRLPVTITPGPLGFEGSGACTTEGCMPEDFVARLVDDHCTINKTQGRASGNDCADRASQAELHVCAAQTLLAIIDAPAPLQIAFEPAGQGFDGLVRIGPQDAETESEFARLALAQAGLALREVADAFDTKRSTCTDSQLKTSAGSTPPLADMSLAEELAGFYAESLEIAATASGRLSETGSAVSDAAYSRQTDSASASTDALAPFASRTAAAHALVGGELGLPAIAGVDESGFFTRPRLTAEAQRAIELFRVAALDPDAIIASTHSIDDIVLGTGSISLQNSLRFRIGHFQSRPSLYGAITADAAYYQLGVDRGAFVEARDYLREELRAFDRSREALLPPETVAGAQTTAELGVLLYAAVRNPPRQLHTSYWAAVLRYDGSPNPSFSAHTDPGDPPAWAVIPDTSGNLPPGDTWATEVDAMTATPQVQGRRTLASILDEGYLQGPEIMERLCPAASCAGDELRAARDTIALVMAGAHPDPLLGSADPPDARYGNAAHIGRARACVFVEDSKDTDFDVRVELLGLTGVSDPAELLVVRGRDGLSCAVDGTIEGVPCDAAEFANAMSFNATFSLSNAGVWSAMVPKVELGARPTGDTLSLFIVRGAEGNTHPGGPGTWEELTGFILPKPDDPTTIGYRYCAGAIMAPAIDEAAAELIRPSTTPPHRPAQSCAGLPTDLRIPLENELTSDTGGAPGPENSWRHYLDLARSSAAEADQLGEDLIRTGLEMDLRAEAAADELTRLCGVTINLTAIAGAVEDGPPAAVAVPMGGCTLPYVQRGDQCVLDPVLYAAEQASGSEDMRRLAGCMGVDRVPWATLGDTTLCAWDTDPGSSAGFCSGSDWEEMPCPYVAPTDAVDDSSCTEHPSGATGILIDQRIAIFQRPAEIPPPPPNPNDHPCAELASLRATGTVENLEQAARVAGFATYDSFAPLARNLTWEADVGNRSVVRYGGSLVYRVAPASESPLWPGGNPPLDACPTSMTTNIAAHSGPLFCLGDLSGIADEDTHRLRRAQMNDLLARAVLAAKVSTSGSFDGMVFPYYAPNEAHEYVVTPDSFDWRGVSGSSPARYSATSGRFTIDHSASDTAGQYQREASELGSRFAFIQGSDATAGSGCSAVPATAEWARCPYDNSASASDCVVFDDTVDCDDLAVDDHNVPLVLRSADREISRFAEPAARQLWADELGFIPFAASTFTLAESRALLPTVSEDTSNYYRDFGYCALHAYEDCVDGVGYRRLTSGGNLAFIAPNGLTVNDFLNGMELACWAARSTVPVEDTSCDEPRNIQTLTDAYRMRGYLECRANEISAFASSSLVQNLPRRVVEALRREGSGTYGGGAGEFDAQVAELRAALLELGNHRLELAADIRSFSARIQALDAAVSRSERAREIERLSLMANAMDRFTQCVTAMADAATVDPAKAAGGAASAAATCVNTQVQMNISTSISQLRSQDVGDAIIEEFARFTMEASSFGTRMSQRSLAVRAAFERIDGALARLRITQSSARTAAARALLLEGDGMDRHFGANAVYRARYSTGLVRYRRAHQRAVRSAFIARLALEQRLGMPLADIEDDLYSDEAPREWVDTICTLPSIDYDRLRSAAPPADGTRESDGSALPVPDDYSGMYVGDYVDKLEQVFESYSFVHPFREGTDTAVISLRDDVFRSRASCEVASPNQLPYGGRLDVRRSSSRPGWELSGCNLGAGTGSTGENYCVAVSVNPSTNPLPLAAAGRGERPAAYLIEFGDETHGVTGDDTQLEQTLYLEPGRYRVSVYSDTATPVVVEDDEVTGGVHGGTEFSTTDGVEPGWTRYWQFVDIPTAREVRITVPRLLQNNVVRNAISVAGVMVENVTGSVVGAVDRTVTISEGDGTETTVLYGLRAEPPPFVDGSEDGLVRSRACLDHTGGVFRRRAWERGCVRVCRDGYDGNCPSELADTRCYWQTSFGISSDSLSSMLLAGDAGFAAGNHNYRVETVAVNLVGTGLRDCEGSRSSGCYGSGSTSYSLMHLGPYLVRNATGALYEAPLFPGRLESARALAAERYVTNPMSSADRALVEPYTRHELQGRPLGGSLVLRLWDDPSFRFDRVEDVQIVLGYRYWQHQR